MTDDMAAADRDLTRGVPLAAFEPSGLVAGKLGEADVLLVRTASGIHAIGAKCTHNGAALAQGRVVGETIRCPWHHACFDVRTGAATAAPAFRPLGAWAVEERGGRVFVGTRAAEAQVEPGGSGGPVVIVGAGAAGTAAADALVRLGHRGAVTVIGREDDAPYDRTMLTKHFLSGQADDAGLLLPMDDLRARGVDLRLGVTVAAIERETRQVRLADGDALPYAALILATGAEPRRLMVPGADLPHVTTLRSVADARRILTAVEAGPRIVVIGGSFIGLEAAAALRDRGLAVTVVSPNRRPLAKVLGSALSDAITAVHRARGTELRLGRTPVRITPSHVELDDGSALPADLVIVGIGVTPRTALAEAAGLTVEDGVVVDTQLRTSDPAIFAVGDIARWPDPHSGSPIRVEHWAVAQRQGQIAAANVSGAGLAFDMVPFFWTLQFDWSARFVGHAKGDDASVVEGDLAAKSAVVRFPAADRDRAVVTVERDDAGLDAELAMERRLGGPAATLPLRPPTAAVCR